ncbi:MAG: hypothetical protein ACREQY_09325, partial [Candidatus Binatia bacterium]
MTTDVRELLRRAAEAGPDEVAGARRAMRRGESLRRRRRVGIIALATVAVALAVAAVVPGTPLLDDVLRIAPTRPGQDRQVSTPEPTPPANAAPDQPAERSDEAPDRVIAAGEPGAERSSSGITPPTCDPLIDDSSGDTGDARIDIERSTISYDEAANSLVFEHTMRDLERPESGHSLHFDLQFWWDGLRYSAEAMIDGAGQDNFAIVRPRRNGAPGPVNWVELGTPTGSFDTTSETVALRVSLDEFNDGEKSASLQEGMPPPKELEAGSKLTEISLHT